MKQKKDPVLLVRKNQEIVHLTLNRPLVLNALNAELLHALQEALNKIKNTPSVKGFFIAGAGEKAFSAGADIAFLNTASPLQIRELAELAVSVTGQIENLGKPSIALINGFALGGGLELAESCMLRVAVSSAKMGHPEVRIGAVSGWGGSTRLPRLIGKGRAAELLLTGKMISAGEALDMGLVNAVVENAELEKAGEKLMREIIDNAPVAVRFTWEALHRGMNMTSEESARLGADYFGLAASTEDFREGTKAFLKKRKPSFKGK
ncbi:MAG: enoyl-CoA hydratase [Nitrospira bacterium SG8_35_4]|nr:MAG: enoyl-CoA hydratase [Nitrospira bacterium SG8_35_4]